MPYFSLLRKFSERLKKAINEASPLTVEDYIKILFDFFEKHDAREHFKDWEVTEDKLRISIYSGFENKVWFNRIIRLEDVDDELQIHCELLLDEPFENLSLQSNEIERDILGDFFTEDSGYIHFSDYREEILAYIENIKLTKLVPKGISIYTHYDA